MRPKAPGKKTRGAANLQSPQKIFNFLSCRRAEMKLGCVLQEQENAVMVIGLGRVQFGL